MGIMINYTYDNPSIEEYEKAKKELLRQGKVVCVMDPVPDSMNPFRQCRSVPDRKILELSKMNCGRNSGKTAMYKSLLQEYALPDSIWRRENFKNISEEPQEVVPKQVKRKTMELEKQIASPSKRTRSQGESSGARQKDTRREAQSLGAAALEMAVHNIGMNDSLTFDDTNERSSTPVPADGTLNTPDVSMGEHSGVVDVGSS